MSAQWPGKTGHPPIGQMPWDVPDHGQDPEKPDPEPPPLPRDDPGPQPPSPSEAPDTPPAQPPPIPVTTPSESRAPPFEESLASLAAMVRQGQRAERALLLMLGTAASSMNYTHHALLQLDPKDWQQNHMLGAAHEILEGALALVTLLAPLFEEQTKQAAE